jgi:hypothetical protein
LTPKVTEPFEGLGLWPFAVLVEPPAHVVEWKMNCRSKVVPAAMPGPSWNATPWVDGVGRTEAMWAASSPVPPAGATVMPPPMAWSITPCASAPL